MSDKYRPLLVRLPPQLDERLRYFASVRERHLSWVIRKALGEYLDRNEMDGSSTIDAHTPPAFMPQGVTIQELIGEVVMAERGRHDAEETDG